MKAFTLLEVLVAILMSSFLLLIVNRSHFVVTHTMRRNVFPEVVLLGEGLRRQLEHLSQKEFLYRGKKTKTFFIWDEKRLAFVTEWNPAGPMIVCYRRGKKDWHYSEILLTENKIPEDYCEDSGTSFPGINLRIISKEEEITEITPGKRGAFSLYLESPSYIRALPFNL